jgi:hypothetical protein
MDRDLLEKLLHGTALMYPGIMDDIIARNNSTPVNARTLTGCEIDML